jgi:probable F420-dependent oxidoreductase
MSGRVGVWAPYRLLASAEGREVAAELEELGYRAIWIGNGQSMLELAASLLSATTRISVATGVLNIRRNPVAAEAAPASYARLAAVHPGRFLLGLGSGWAPGAGVSPYRGMVAYLDRLDSTRPPVPAAGRILAALGPKMFALAAQRSAGAHPFLTTPEHTHWARQHLGAGALLVPEQKVLLETDPATARAIARAELDFYLTKENYLHNLRRFGFTDDDFQGGGSDWLVDALVAWGDADTVADRVREHHRASADQVAIQPISPDTPLGAAGRLPRLQYRRLAESLQLT